MNFDIHQLVKKISLELNITVSKTEIPDQGMENFVFFIIEDTGKEYAVKIGEGCKVDITAYELIQKYSLNLPSPSVYLSGTFGNLPFLVMSKINQPQLDVVIEDKFARYLSSIVQTVKEIHKITSVNSGSLCDVANNRGWREFHLSKFNNSSNSLKWDEIAKRDCLDENLILRCIERYLIEFSKMKVVEGSYSLLHNDYNQKNIFINLADNRISGIIDWGDAIFGDPIYDFSRLRLLFWHYDVWDEIEDYYYKLVNFTSKQKEFENLYFISRVIEYLAYYSQKVDDFSRPRIALHQKFLGDLGW